MLQLRHVFGDYVQWNDVVFFLKSACDILYMVVGLFLTLAEKDSKPAKFVAYSVVTFPRPPVIYNKD